MPGGQEVMEGNVDVKYCYIDTIYKGGYHIYVYIGIHLDPPRLSNFSHKICLLVVKGLKFQTLGIFRYVYIGSTRDDILFSTQKCRRLAGGSAIVKTGIVYILDTSVSCELIQSLLIIFFICSRFVSVLWVFDE